MSSGFCCTHSSCFAIASSRVATRYRARVPGLWLKGLPHLVERSISTSYRSRLRWTTLVLMLELDRLATNRPPINHDQAYHLLPVRPYLVKFADVAHITEFAVHLVW